MVGGVDAAVIPGGVDRQPAGAHRSPRKRGGSNLWRLPEERVIHLTPLTPLTPLTQNGRESVGPSTRDIEEEEENRERQNSNPCSSARSSESDTVDLPRRTQQLPPPECCELQELKESRQHHEMELIVAAARLRITGGHNDGVVAAPVHPESPLPSSPRYMPTEPKWTEIEQLLASTSAVYIDSHAHLDFIYNAMCREDKFNSLEELRDAFPRLFPMQFAGCIANFIDPRLFIRNLSSKFRQYDMEWMLRVVQSPLVAGATYGVHPHHADKWDESCEAFLRHACQHRQRSRIVAIGECGVDLAYKNVVPLSTQLRVLEAQVRLAVQHGLPLVIHCRGGERGDAETSVLEVLTRLAPTHPIHRHCFMSDEGVARRWLTGLPNCVFGFTPFVWQAGSRHQVRAVHAIPLDRIVLETDAPYFAPNAMREVYPRLERTSLPPMAVYAAIKIAEIKNVTVDEVLSYSFRTTCRIYGLEREEDGRWTRID